jgi:hypothetical protein
LGLFINVVVPLKDVENRNKTAGPLPFEGWNDTRYCIRYKILLVYDGRTVKSSKSIVEILNWLL